MAGARRRHGPGEIANKITVMCRAQPVRFNVDLRGRELPNMISEDSEVPSGSSPRAELIARLINSLVSV
ncbi:hypothetical protein DAEQUDRAFT_720893 [Daedalea quercina L-15889]|uniref:Uncharacterized protein n=1 Tax=Daedalea quercina L-15889 TaxID=1314783 RepID=A0A165TW28_9APHY|nr:hypothetical protein DAEQUDRAFT_720893 [Daedalea quercina L-15889]